MKGCGVLVCPGTKFCSRLQSFVLRGSAECRWDRGESSGTEERSRWGREKREGLFCISSVSDEQDFRAYSTGDARWSQRLHEKDIKG